MEARNRAYLYGLAAVLLWSTAASAFKLALRYLEPLQLLLYSAVVSTAALGLMLVRRGQLVTVLASLPSQVRHSAALGFLNPFLYYAVLLQAYDRLPAQVAQPLNYTWALALALLSIPILKQRLLVTDLAAGAVCYSGVLVIATRGAPDAFELSDPLGVGLALGSTVVWALYWLYNARDPLDPVARLFLNFLCSLPLALAACLIFGGQSLKALALPGLPGLLGAVYVGLFEMGLTFVLWLTALRLADNASRVGNLIFLSPFVSLVLIHYLVGETIHLSTLAGLALIVAGLVVQRLGATRRRLSPRDVPRSP